MSPVNLSLRHWVPPEVEFPVETSPRHVRPSDIFKCLVADDVNDRRHNGMSASTSHGHQFTMRSMSADIDCTVVTVKLDDLCHLFDDTHCISSLVYMDVPVFSLWLIQQSSPSY